VRCRDARAWSFVGKVRGEIFAHLHGVSVKRHSSMRNWLFVLSERIICEHSPWCQRKWWARSSPVSSFSVSVSLDFPCAVHAFFPEHLSNHCQGFHQTFSEICTKFDTVPLSNPLRNLIKPDIRLHIKWRKNEHFYPAT
jgi:hypothetical protein